VGSCLGAEICLVDNLSCGMSFCPRDWVFFLFVETIGLMLNEVLGESSGEGGGEKTLLSLTLSQ